MEEVYKLIDEIQAKYRGVFIDIRHIRGNTYQLYLNKKEIYKITNGDAATILRGSVMSIKAALHESLSLKNKLENL